MAKLNIKQATTAQTITFSADGIGSTTTQLAANTDTNAAAANSSSSAASSSSSVANNSSPNSASSSSSVTTSSSTNAASQALAGSSSDQPAFDPAQANNNNTSGSLGITINGNFSDWEDITKTSMHFNGDNDNLKDVALLADQNNIYFYVAMKPQLSGGVNTIGPGRYELTIGGKTFYITINNQQTVSLNDINAAKKVSVNIASDNNVVNDSSSGQAYVMKQENTLRDGSKADAYVMECSIPLSALKGTSNTTGQTIKLANSGLWTGSVQTSGGSTGPVVLAGAGFAIALFSVIKLSGNKRKKYELRGTK
ncbi:Firmicu-CTERM sorting domain-containing protein [Loigolactobacillus coryniformis]|uniref:Firmicu-CTERM sorting domain-containing protein n=1 Tax=Loigolactobacillus coryniformis TaxID=1610 RepID=UPI0023409975|nr:Firmicu-CTERM sorting domain-containing protein [Loigolactobacillus coryniformis]MDC4186095.1 Firmicu-CTERM sorting domain-containing protein [Loigolactobacillus coryniformis]